MKSCLAALVFMFLVAPALRAQDSGLPAGRWWRIPRVAERLQLTPAQQQRLDQVFHGAAPDLIDLRADVNLRASRFRDLTVDPSNDPGQALQAAEALASARSALFVREVRMLLDMRTALNERQWRMIRELVERGSDPQRRPPHQQRRRRQ